jgi:Domain of unknown function (DUF4440)
MTTMAYRSRAGIALAVLALTLSSTVSAVNAVGRPAPRLADPARTAGELVNRYFRLVAEKDRAGLQSLLSSGFQVERADGSGAGKKAYLANLPTIEEFHVTKLRATQAGGTLVARYLADVRGVVNGKTYAPGPAPRLSVFAWNGQRWQVAAHANFNPLRG